MKNQPFLLALLIVLISISCKVNCPPDEKVGTIDLSDTTETYIPSFYLNESTLVFKNESGELLKLHLNSQEEQMDKLCVETICTELEFDGKSTCKYFDAASHRFIYANENSSILMDLLFHIDLAKTKTEYFYDVMQISMSTQDNFFGLSQHHTDIRFEDASATIPEPNNRMTVINEVQLIDTTFTNVYANEQDPLKTYYTRDSGLVGFDINGEVWRFIGTE